MQCYHIFFIILSIGTSIQGMENQILSFKSDYDGLENLLREEPSKEQLAFEQSIKILCDESPQKPVDKKRADLLTAYFLNLSRKEFFTKERQKIIYAALKGLSSDEKERLKELLLNTADDLSDGSDSDGSDSDDDSVIPQSKTVDYDKFRQQVVTAHQKAITHTELCKTKANTICLVKACADANANLLEQIRAYQEELKKGQEKQMKLEKNLAEISTKTDRFNAAQEFLNTRVDTKIAGQTKKTTRLKEKISAQESALDKLNKRLTELTCPNAIIATKNSCKETAQEINVLKTSLEAEQALLKRMIERKNNPQGKGVLGTFISFK